MNKNKRQRQLKNSISWFLHSRHQMWLKNSFKMCISKLKIMRDRSVILKLNKLVEWSLIRCQDCRIYWRRRLNIWISWRDSCQLWRRHLCRILRNWKIMVDYCFIFSWEVIAWEYDAQIQLINKSNKIESTISIKQIKEESLKC